MNRQPFISRLAIALTVGCVSLAACATPAREPVVKTVTVLVPTPVTCVPSSLRPEPAYPDTAAAIKASPGPGDLLQLLMAGRILREQWLSEIRPVLIACRKPDG